MSLFHMNLLPPPSAAFLYPEDGSSGCPRNVGAYIPVDTVSSKGILVTGVRASDLKNRFSRISILSVHDVH